MLIAIFIIVIALLAFDLIKENKKVKRLMASNLTLFQENRDLIKDKNSLIKDVNELMFFKDRYENDLHNSNCIVRNKQKRIESLEKRLKSTNGKI